MDAYKKAIGSKRKIISNASKWIKEKGKQTYKFPGDKTLHNPRCQLCEKLCYPAEKITHNGTPYHKNCLRCIYCGKKKAPADVSPIGETTFVCDQHKHKVLKSKKSKSKVSVQKPAEKKEQHSKNDNETEKETKSRLSRNPKMGVDQKEKTTESSGLTKIEEGVEWRAEGRKQVYNYPEDVKGPKKRIDPRCHKCGKTVYPAEKFTYEMIPYHRNCVRCLECKIKLTPSNATPFGDEDFLCNNHFQKVIGKINLRSRSRAPAANETNKTFKTTEDLSKGIKWSRSGKKQAYKYLEDLKEKPNPRCNFCGKTTYPAETVTYNSIPYHTACFRCLRCGKKLIGGDANPFGEENYLCNNHYNGVLMEIGTETKSKISKTEKTTTIVNVDEYGYDPRMYVGYEWRVKKGKQTYKYPEDLSNKGKTFRCNYCGKKSYPAETATYERIPYHQSCFRCLMCNKKLTTANATPFGEEVFLCDTHFERFGQGGGFPKKNEKVEKVEEVKEDDDEMANLSAVERRRLRRKRMKEKKNRK